MVTILLRHALRRRLCDSCCLTVGSVVAFLLALLLPLLAPWHALLEPQSSLNMSVSLPRSR